MNLKNYFNEIKHFLKENADDPENLGTEDTGETPPEDENVDQGEGDDLNNISGQQNSTLPPQPSGEPDLQSSVVNTGDNPPSTPTTTDQSGNAVQQAGGANPGADQGGDTGQQTNEQQGEGESGATPAPQAGTEKFGTILGQLKELFDTFEQAKKTAGFETIDDVKKAANENQAASKAAANNGGGSGGTPAT